MKTKEEFLQEAYGYKFEEEDFINPAIIITLNAMEKYAQEVANNLHKADVIKCDGDERKALLIDFISWYLNVFMRDKKLTKTKTPIQSIDIFLNSINSL
jgi:hypothetical protein